MISNDGSWITKPKWQILVGVLVMLSILGAYFGFLIALQHERDQRQLSFQAESVQRDNEIKDESARVTCGIILGFERLTPQIPLTGEEDELTRQRIIKTNADRLAARQILRLAMPTDIVAKCPEASN